MTQPPNQPPHGGFGAPQDPRQGGDGSGQPAQPPTPPAGGPPQAGAPAPGYGYPPQQPGQAGPYGYPQQPGPYAEPGPYGQPAQPGPYAQQPGPYTKQPAPPGPYAQQPGPYAQPAQPGPYGQPTQPGQAGPYGPQPGYGYPGPGGPGGPGVPPGGGKGPFKGRTAVIIGAAVAALLVAGGAVYAVVGGGDDKKSESKKKGPKTSASAPANPGDGSGDGYAGKEDLNEGRQADEAEVLWYKEAPKAPGKGADAPGMWVKDGIAVKAAYKELLAYHVDSGKPAWSAIEFPQEICAASPQYSDDGKIAVAYKNGIKSGAECDQMQIVDLKTGEKGWKKKIKEEGLFDSTLGLELSITGDTLMVGRSQSGTAYSVSGGHEKFVARKKDEGTCFPAGFTGGDRMLMALSCGASTPTEHDEIVELDPESGATKWTKKFPKGWRLEHVYSTSPTVLYATNEDKKQWNITTLKPGSSATRSEVQVNDDFAPECGWGGLGRDLQDCAGVAADDKYLYLPTKKTTGANEIVAISLDSGKAAWREKSPQDTSMLPMKIQGGDLVAYVEPSYDSGGRVVSLGTSGSHTPKTLLKHPAGTSKIENGFFSRATDYVDGRFYLSTTRLSGTAQGREKLMLAYGK
ncbi:PQQ-binding-like beta-propeller repeat protein [Streptomyces sp. NPDC017941]|uniref:outer membrane protein assembly factor BamB family protein n=1 Tax=Streptomyces sp. NPDC017941 TaxID=3365018 RepID=UPI0037A943C2